MLEVLLTRVISELRELGCKDFPPSEGYVAKRDPAVVLMYIAYMVCPKESIIAPVILFEISVSTILPYPPLQLFYVYQLRVIHKRLITIVRLRRWLITQTRPPEFERLRCVSRFVLFLDEMSPSNSCAKPTSPTPLS